MDGVEAPGERFRRRALPPPATEDRADGYGGSAVDLEARIAPTMAFRVRDEFPPERREELPDGGFRVRLRLPDNEWMYEYLIRRGPAGPVSGAGPAGSWPAGTGQPGKTNKEDG